MRDKLKTALELLKGNKNVIPYAIFRNITKLGLTRIIPDDLYLKIAYKLATGYVLDLDKPQTFNEKIQYLKLYDRKPKYIVCVDKYKVREYIANIIGSEYLIPLLGVWEKANDIDFDNLPDQFVLKCNHDSGSVIICNNKKRLSKKQTIKKLNKALKNTGYWFGREWPYKDIKPCILAEKYMTDESGYELKDYKIFVFNGIPQFIQVDFDRFTNHHRNFYDTTWNYVPFTTCYPTDPNKQIMQPSCLAEMLNIAEKITSDIGKPAFCRIDLYVINNKIYFGEITFYHGSGFEKFEPEEWDEKLGELIDLTVIRRSI